MQRLWIVYEHHCERHAAASFGEVRVGEPGPAGPVGVAPSIVRWPLGDLDHAGEPVPVHVRFADAATLGPVSIGGADHDDFEIGVDDCSGHSLPKGSQCEVWVRLTPTTTGTRLATLRIPEGSRVHEVALQAFAHGGRTRVHMVSDPGDPLGAGSTWDYNPGTALLQTWDANPGVSFHVQGFNGDWWYADFVAGPGRTRAPGGSAPPPVAPGTTQPRRSITAPAARSSACATATQRRLPLRRGTRRADRMRGTRRGERLILGAGSDRVHALAGDDCVDAGAGNDLVYGDGGRDALFGGAGADVIRGGPGSDVLVSGRGTDALYGGAGNDTLVGGPGRDRLDCGAGRRDVARGVSRSDSVSRCERVARTRTHQPTGSATLKKTVMSRNG